MSKRISDLERALGVELLRRTTRGVVATDRGRAFHARARTILQELDEATDEAAEREGRLCGSLRIAAPMSFGTLVLGPILFAFLAEHPELAVDVDLDDRVVDAVALGYDFVVRIGPVADSSLVARRIGTSRRIVCASPEYARRHGLPRDLDELERHVALGYSYRQSSRVWRFEPERPGGKPRSVAMRHRVACNNGEAIRDAAVAGLGLALLPHFIAAGALRSGALVEALAAPRPIPDEIHALYPRTKQPSRKIRALLDHLRGRIGDDGAAEHESASGAHDRERRGEPDRARTPSVPKPTPGGLR